MQVRDAIVRSQTETVAEAVDDIEGTLPAGLDGVLLRNGGGTMRVGNDDLAFLDAHGLVGALEVAEGRAFLRTVYPDTSVRRAELAAGAMKRRRVFTNLPQRWRNVMSIKPGTGVSHDTYVWGDRVYASDLGAHYGLDTPKLTDAGEPDWGLDRFEMVAPMPREDLAANTLVAYGLKQDPRGDRLRFVEVDERFEQIAKTEPVKLSGLVHDHAFTDRWYVAVESPLKPNPLKAVWGSAPLWNAIELSDGALRVVLVPRGRSGDPVVLDVPTDVRVAFHVINAYDDGDEVVVDIIGYEGRVSFESIMPSTRSSARPTPTNRIQRLRLRPSSGSVDVSTFDAQGEAPEVAPAVHGRRHTATWFVNLPSGDADEPFLYPFSHAIGRLDVTDGSLTTWDAGEGHQISPPALAPDPGSDDPESGWLLAWDLDLDRETTDVVVLDASDLPAGPISRIRLGGYLPAVSHARFAPGLRIS